MLVLGEVVDNIRTVLQDLVVHVTHASREATPVGKDDERDSFTAVEVTNRLSGFVGAIRPSACI
jgi:hypothetical protein